MEVLANAVVVIIMQISNDHIAILQMYQINTLYILNLHNVICQFYLNFFKKEENNKSKSPGSKSAPFYLAHTSTQASCIQLPHFLPGVTINFSQHPWLSNHHAQHCLLSKSSFLALPWIQFPSFMSALDFLTITVKFLLTVPASAMVPDCHSSKHNW